MIKSNSNKLRNKHFLPIFAKIREKPRSANKKVAKTLFYEEETVFWWRHELERVAAESSRYE